MVPDAGARAVGAEASDAKGSDNKTSGDTKTSGGGAGSKRRRTEDADPAANGAADVGAEELGKCARRTDVEKRDALDDPEIAAEEMSYADGVVATVWLSLSLSRSIWRVGPSARSGGWRPVYSFFYFSLSLSLIDGTSGGKRSSRRTQTARWRRRWRRRDSRRCVW